jgi:glutamate synthase domain-containing protein 1
MCGIAGIIYRNHGGAHAVGHDMTAMLQSMKHRGPDSTGYALYGQVQDTIVMRYTLADANDARDFDFEQRLDHHRREVETRLRAFGARNLEVEKETGYAYRVTFDYDGDLKPITDVVEDVPNVEVARQYRLDDFVGTHAIGHVRMATESDVDISGAHPYWAYPFGDVAVVHNGQLTNYFQWKHRLERAGHRFQSECDSEVIAVYLAEKMSDGSSLEDAMRESLEELDGVFTYICVTGDALGVAKDHMAAKPLVLYEADDMVALASEEIAIRAIVDHEIETWDPYEGEVMVWKR